MFKRNQIVTVGIAGLHSQYQGRIVSRAKGFDGRLDSGWWVVKEIPADAERVAFFKSMRRHPGMCVHESQLAA
jgi:hypothetical protein